MAVPPLATFRVQLGPDFGYRDAADVVDFVAGLGCSHLYLSPVFAARDGSAHGYDVTDPTSLRDELGGEAGFDELVQRVKAAGLGLVVDIVPNHMAANPANRWWRDVLENGRSSRYATMFDIDWEQPEERLRGKVVLPILADHYGRELEAGRIRLVSVDGQFEIRYFDHVLPVAPESAPLASNVEELNGDYDALDRLLEEQHYRLVRWQASSDELSHRRFFDISDLAAVRQEDPNVFNATHALVARWVGEETVDGIRVDHVDGMRQPAEYVERLRRLAPKQWIVVEKILEVGEQVPAGWPVDGTTGYDFGRDVMSVLVDPAGCSILDALQHDLGVEGTWHETVVAAKTEVLRDVLGGDLSRVTETFVRVCENHRRHRDHTRPELRRGLRGALAHLDVYRTYVYGNGEQATTDERRRIEAAVKGAVADDAGLDDELLGFLGRILCGDVDGSDADDLRARFEQLSAPATAKGVEDTALYRWAPSLAMAEVGLAPGGSEIDVSTFHQRILDRARRFSSPMLTTSTHDSKRSEDVRARLAVLTEVADEWRSQALVWHERYAEPGCPDPFTEHLLYQTLVGAHPLSRDRLNEYLTKAMREAKHQTSWIKPDEDHEEAVIRFTDALVSDSTFRAELDAWVERILLAGRINSLTQKLLCLTCPGVPDIYQGTDIWNLSLVDPDNRRPVEWEAHRRVAASADIHAATAALEDPDDPGIPKLFMIRRTLEARRNQPDSFGPDAPYMALAADGPGADRVVAFSRGGAIVAVPLLPLSTTADARSSTTIDLPPGHWFDAFTGAERSGAVTLADLWTDFPVTLLLTEALAL